MSHYRQNQAAWNRIASQKNQFSKVATDEECRNPLKVLDGRGWLPQNIQGQRVLCLASGGGWQSILYASAGADVTVVDLSSAMLHLDRREATRRKLNIKTIEASMDSLPMLTDASFDIIHQPVSSCYIEELAPLYNEVARLLCVGGVYISQHKTPTSLQIEERDNKNRYVIGLKYYQQKSLPVMADTSYREEGTVEYLHRWEQLVGGLCQAGFVIEDLCEPYRADETAAAGHFKHRGCFVAPYLRMKARRVKDVIEKEKSILWKP